RAAFPALASGVTFLDNAGGSQVLASVAERVRDYLCSTSVQLGASYPTSREAGERVHGAVCETAAYIGARDPAEVVFGGSTTQLLANLALALEPTLAAGDELVITNADHQANLGPWQRLAHRRGLVLREWSLDRDTHRLEPAALARLLTPRTRLVAFPHVSNLLGSIHDIRAITQLVHSAGAQVCVDGVAYAPHRGIDVTAWDVDYYVFSIYKVYGPHVAVLYGKRELLEALPTINHNFITQLPYKLQPGNVNFELTYGAAAVWPYLARVGFDEIAVHEAALAERLLGFLRDRPHVHIHGDVRSDASVRVPTISFTVDGREPDEIVRAVDARNIGIRHGDFYSKGVVAAFGVPSVIRISAVHYNTLAEIDHTVAALEAAGV
ncbi:MAG TPA: aminotransferase class V-fold PLP-dependent enzyme, partial [Kofleriaceae bacterium]|nr:aminotransferase class V-fold PLP-dependent enzyme [Kofleriaceae bacterium]